MAEVAWRLAKGAAADERRPFDAWGGGEGQSHRQ